MSFWNLLKGGGYNDRVPRNVIMFILFLHSHYNHCQNNRFTFVLCSHYNLEWGIRILMPHIFKELEQYAAWLWPFQYSVNGCHSAVCLPPCLQLFFAWLLFSSLLIGGEEKWLANQHTAFSKGQTGTLQSAGPQIFPSRSFRFAFIIICHNNEAILI